MQQINLDSFKGKLSREEMKMVNGGRVQVTCKNGTLTMTSDTASWNDAVSIAQANCGGGGYTIICTAEHCA